MRYTESFPMPDGKTKAELLEILEREEYGRYPKYPIKVTVEVESVEKRFCAGNAHFITLRFTCEGEFGTHSFPVFYTKRLSDSKVPCFIHLNFDRDVPHKYQPTEEIIDNGYSVLSFCHKDVTSDDPDFTNGLAGVIFENGVRKNGDDCGKIMMWAWAAMRVMDYALTLDELDPDRITVIGHSRLGKTALLAGALDERFYCAISSGSGCGGASIARGNTGETVEAIIRNWKFWFCENYYKYANREDSMPFDQHFLIAANYPHRVYVSSGSDDWWAHPENEHLGIYLASGYYREHGMEASITEKFPEIGEAVNGGYVGYHLRKGPHFLSRYDWGMYFKFLSE